MLKNFEERLYPLAEIYENSEADVKKLFCAHIKVAESLADTDLKSGDKIIWRQDAGKTAGDFVMSFMEKCNNLENIQTIDYEGFFNTLLSEYNVRSRYGMHPRVKILGPIEARLTQYDTVIIGEANEGCWPQMPRADMWMSRPMKKDFGLPQPERAVGVAAADFAHLLNAPEVYVTRAKKVDGAPSNKSRWWLRFETVLAANFNSQADKYDFIYEQPFSVWARNLDSCAEPRACAAPAPCPPVEHRPRILSATNVDNLRRDPYTIYAKYILDLYPLDDLDKEDSASDYGSFIHEVLQKFNDLHNRDYPEKEKAEAELLKIAEEKLKDKHIKDETAALWRERILQQLKWIVETEIRYREDIDLVHNEIKGQIKLNAPAGDFTITAKADRLDETKDGYVNIIDYKTGKSASVRAVVAGNAPQLPIEGIIAEAGGFADVLPQMVKSFQYWDFKTVKTTSEEQSRKAMEVTVKNLAELLADFDNPETPYIANPVRGLGSDYAHLSRFLEWSVKEDVVEEEDENE